jgi:hypothetical protein
MLSESVSRAEAYLHIRAGILLLFVVWQCETCLNKKYIDEISEIGLSLCFPNIEKSIFNSIWFHILLERVNRFLDRRISPKKLFGFWIWRIFYTDLIVQRIADLSNILAQIVDLACILDWLKFRQDHCQIGGFCFKFGRIGEFVYPYSPPPPPPLFMSEKIVFVGKMLPLPPPPKTWDPWRPCTETVRKNSIVFDYFVHARQGSQRVRVSWVS